MIYILLLLFIIIITLCLLKNKNILVPLVCSLIIVYIILHPKFCIDATLSGATLFFYKVFPSLFPFLILINLIIFYDGVHIYSKTFGKILCSPLRLNKKCSLPIVISMLCGYPLGAKFSCDLYESKNINFYTLTKLLNIATNASPLFIVGSVGTSMLKNPYAGYILLISNYISCIIIGLFLPSHNTSYRTSPVDYKFKEKNIGEALKISIENSIKTCINIGGFIVIFSVFITILKSNAIFTLLTHKISVLLSIDHNLIQGFILGLIEITNGCYLISTSCSNIYLKLILISFILSFSGFSIICQVYSFTYKHKVNMKRYLKIKIIQSIICSFICIALYNIPFLNVNLNAFNELNLHLHYSYKSAILIILILLLFIFPILNNLCFNKNNH